MDILHHHNLPLPSLVVQSSNQAVGQWTFYTTITCPFLSRWRSSRRWAAQSTPRSATLAGAGVRPENNREYFTWDRRIATTRCTLTRQLLWPSARRARCAAVQELSCVADRPFACDVRVFSGLVFLFTVYIMSTCVAGGTRAHLSRGLCALPQPRRDPQRTRAHRNARPLAIPPEHARRVL